MVKVSKVFIRMRHEILHGQNIRYVNIL